MRVILMGLVTTAAASLTGCGTMTNVQALGPNTFLATTSGFGLGSGSFDDSAKIAARYCSVRRAATSVIERPSDAADPPKRGDLWFQCDPDAA